MVVSSMTGVGYTLLILPPVRRSSGGSIRGAIRLTYQFPTGDLAKLSIARSYTLM